MRYLMDKLELPPKFSSGDEAFGGKYACFYVCKVCGAELYSEYIYPGTYYSSFTMKEWERDLERKRSRLSPEKFSSEEKLTRQLRERLNRCEELKEIARKRCNATFKAANCPVCGARLEHETGYFCINYSYLRSLSKDMQEQMRSRTCDEDDYDKIFEYMKSFQDEIDQKQISREVNLCVPKCDLPTCGSETHKAGEIKTDREALKVYLLNLIQLENNIYSLKQQLSNLYLRRLRNNREVVFSQNSPAYEVKAAINKLHVSYDKAVVAIEEAKVSNLSVTVAFPEEPIKPVLEKPGLFNRKKVLQENEALTAKYLEDKKAYLEEVQRCEEEKSRLISEKRAVLIKKAQAKADSIKGALDKAEYDADRKIKELRERPAPAKAIKEILDKEIAETEELLKKTFAARNELYAYDIVFGKYCDVVALSSFYEYLMSGRCTSLEGADGAYNIYEGEIRANRVIAQLDTVISSLEDIRQNQYMMYHALHTINTSLNNLNRKMDKALISIQSIETNTTSMNKYMENISNNSDVVAHNTAVTAYYSKINAELTNALGYMVAFK